MLIILAPSLLFFIGAGLFEATSSLLSGLGAVVMFVAFAFGALVGGFGLILILGGLLRVTFAAIRRKKNGYVGHPSEGRFGRQNGYGNLQSIERQDD
ncbi:hypothetical protein [Tabrizicola sp.]|uniref:hypothetical protein n=1 Tax=Tabrizicola sp. TaxID=2005166 RepID=UPI00286ACF5F|nr:hypothetical protein [Tabrizicola sp.]